MTLMDQTTSSTNPSLSLVTDKPPTPLEQLSKKEANKLIAWVNEQFTQCRNSRWKHERQWYINLAFYFGRQNIQVLDTPGGSRTFKLYTPPAPYYRARPVVNKIRPLLRTEMSKLTAQKPNAFIVPASGDDRDMYAANAGEQIWDSVFRSKNVHHIIRRAIFWTCVTGNGFIKTYWDEDKPDYSADTTGDICYEVVTPFHLFFPDLKVVDIEEQSFIIHASNRSVAELQMYYGTDIKLERQSGDFLEESFTTVMGVEDEKRKKDTTLVLEMWVKPGKCKEFPSGGMITVAGQSIIAYEPEWPYIHKQYPFAHIRHVETGKFYADSTITDLIPLQREYNRTRGQIIEAKNRMAKPQLAAEIGSLDPNKITSEPGQVIMYRPGFNPPMPIPLQSLPSYVLDEQDRIKMDMDEISGQHEVSRGQVPPGVTAATAISYLQEQDESKLSYTYDSIEECVEKIAFQTLTYVKQFWDTPRMVRITGEDGSFDVLAFQGSDLRDNTDIRVEAGSALPTSRAAKQAFIMDLMKMGFIDPNKGLEVMEIGGINKIYEQIQVDVRQAQRENLKMAQVNDQILEEHRVNALNEFFTGDYGKFLLENQLVMEGPDGDLIDLYPSMNGMPPQPIELPLIVPVNTWDDHRIHIERHNNYRKSQAFDNLDETQKKLFEDHVKQHVSAIMVGAQGAMPFPEGMMDVVNNPETVKEMQNGTGQSTQAVDSTGIVPQPGQSSEAGASSGQEQMQ
jgi:hypothetical protein